MIVEAPTRHHDDVNIMSSALALAESGLVLSSPWIDHVITVAYLPCCLAASPTFPAPARLPPRNWIRRWQQEASIPEMCRHLSELSAVSEPANGSLCVDQRSCRCLPAIMSLYTSELLAVCVLSLL